MVYIGFYDIGCFFQDLVKNAKKTRLPVPPLLCFITVFNTTSWFRSIIIDYTYYMINYIILYDTYYMINRERHI